MISCTILHQYTTICLYFYVLMFSFERLKKDDENIGHNQWFIKVNVSLVIDFIPIHMYLCTYKSALAREVCYCWTCWTPPSCFQSYCSYITFRIDFVYESSSHAWSLRSIITQLHACVCHLVQVANLNVRDPIYQLRSKRCPSLDDDRNFLNNIQSVI